MRRRKINGTPSPLMGGRKRRRQSDAEVALAIALVFTAAIILLGIAVLAWWLT